MPKKNNNIASSIIPQSNYRKSSAKKLNTLNTDIPCIGKAHPKKKGLIEKINDLIILIHEVILKKNHSGKALQKKISTLLFQDTTKKVSTDLHETWKIIELNILNFIKVHYLSIHIESFILAYEQQVGFLINKYHLF